MQSTRFHAGPLRWLLHAGLLTALVAAPALAQINTLKKVVEAPTAAPAAAPESPDETRARLEQWLHEARDTLARLEAPGATAALPEGITAEELDERRRDLEQMALGTTRTLKNLTATAEAGKDLEASRADDAAWTGFKDKPPYPLPIIDELLNERDATEAKLSSYESALANTTGLLATVMGETKTAEENASSMLVAVQHASAATLEAAKWRLEAARAKSRLMAVRASFMQNRGDSLKDRIAATKIDLSLLDRKVKIARANARFNDDDLAKIAKIVETRKQAIQKEIAANSKRLKTAMTARTQAQAAVDALLPQAAPTAADASGLELAKYKLEVAEERVDVLQTLVEGLENLAQLENFGLIANQNRRAILTATNPKQRAKALDSLGNLRERLWAWENVVDDQIAESSAALGKLEARAASITAEDPRAKLLEEQRATLGEKFAMFQRLSQAVDFQRKLIKRWHVEYSPPPVKAGLFERAATLGATTWGGLKKIWSFEVMSFEDKVEVEGQTITGKIPVTLGMLVAGPVVFHDRLLGHLQHRQPHPERAWSRAATSPKPRRARCAIGRMIVVGVFLALGTLAFLKIPLTVFAFFGGALAIGLGIGTQTLIKNFISGIIVLAERKVRVGDILDVDGIIGTVTEINTRSSIIRSPDDVETMIPNSAFLENRVTNWTLSSAKMRRNLRVGVAYGTPPQKVMEVLTESAGRHGLICKDPRTLRGVRRFRRQRAGVPTSISGWNSAAPPTP